MRGQQGTELSLPGQVKQRVHWDACKRGTRSRLGEVRRDVPEEVKSKLKWRYLSKGNLEVVPRGKRRYFYLVGEWRVRWGQKWQRKRKTLDPEGSSSKSDHIIYCANRDTSKSEMQPHWLYGDNRFKPGLFEQIGTYHPTQRSCSGAWPSGESINWTFPLFTLHNLSFAWELHTCLCFYLLILQIFVQEVLLGTEVTKKTYIQRNSSNTVKLF